MPFYVLGALGELPYPRLGACVFLSHSPSMAASCRELGEHVRVRTGFTIPYVPTCTGQAELHGSVQWEAQLRWFLQVNSSSFTAFSQYCLVLTLLLTAAATDLSTCIHPRSPASCAGYQSAPTPNLEQP